MLTGAIFMLEIYDRVLPSRSIPTLIALIIIATVLYGALGLLDFIRGRILVRIGSYLDESISARVYDGLVRLPLKAGNRGEGLQSLRDLDNVRSFLSGTGLVALLRPALAAALSHYLLRISLSDRADRFGRRGYTVRFNGADRGLYARPGQEFGRTRNLTKWACRNKPAQC